MLDPVLFNKYMRYQKIIVSSAILITSILTPTEAMAQATASFILQPDKTSLNAGENLIITIDMNTGGQNVNSYITNLSYPEDKFTYEDINTDGSPFTMALEAKGGNGEVNIIRGTTKAVNGKELIGKASFKAKMNASADEIKLTSKSAIISSDNENILPNSSVQNTTSSTSTSDTSDTKVTTSNPLLKIWQSLVNFFSSIFKN